MQLLEPERDEIIIGPSERNFGFTMAAVFALNGVIGLYRGSTYALLWLCIAIGFAGLALWRPRSLQLANRAWLNLGLLMYRVLNPVIMVSFFRSDPAHRPGDAPVRQGLPQPRARRFVADLLAAALRSETTH